ncbi:methyltransferase domain-containing protein [Phaeospirillum tilakii]|uniref:Methyltransferase domain-containing protein n=1 Tax=Phaeospirillum tilakii TaxID=741673 RepID=A0ABW5CCV3_9PROT
MDDVNGATLDSYEQHVAEYVGGTPGAVSGEVRDWIGAALEGLAPTARLVEIGSGFGRDAAYIQGKGYRIETTDAAESFVAELRRRGFAARRFDLRRDRLEPGQDLILANAVLHHFPRGQLGAILGQLAGALAPGGRLAFSLKRGTGEEWSSAKLGAPRFFCYWEPEQLAPLLAAAGFADWDIVEANTKRAHAAWLYLIARRAATP